VQPVEVGAEQRAGEQPQAEEGGEGAPPPTDVAPPAAPPTRGGAREGVQLDAFGEPVTQDTERMARSRLRAQVAQTDVRALSEVVQDSQQLEAARQSVEISGKRCSVPRISAGVRSVLRRSRIALLESVPEITCAPSSRIPTGPWRRCNRIRSRVGSMLGGKQSGSSRTMM